MVDISNHEDALRELSKTSLINNVTLILCWSSAEGGRYLELFKTYEHASASSIKVHQSNAYSDRMIEFITTPRSINKTDAVSLVSQFGTLRTAVNARYEEVAGIAGWGEKKVVRWCGAVREPFRVKKAARRGLLGREETGGSAVSGEGGEREGSGSPAPGVSGVRTSLVARGSAGVGEGDADRRPSSRLAETVAVDDDAAAFVGDEAEVAEAMTGAALPPKKVAEGTQEVTRKRKPEEDPLSDGVMAALSKLRKEGG